MFRRIPPVILIVLLLAIYGFLDALISDPIRTLIVLGLSVLLYLGVRHYLRHGSFFSRNTSASRPKQPRPKQQPPYRYGVKKQSKQPARKNHPFRVINGSKGKSGEKPKGQDSPNNLSQ
jgi:hypothetical protein